MSSSGVYSYAPDFGDFIEEAFERLANPALRLEKLQRQHFTSAMTSINLMFVEWGNRGVHLFTVEEFTQTLTESDEEYAAPTGTLSILEAVIRRDDIDTAVHHMTREQYHMIPDKDAEGLPSGIWYDRKAGSYRLWQVPENSTDVLRAYRVRQIQTATAGQETPDVPFLWWDALAGGLAARLAEKWAPDRQDKLESKAERAFKLAKGEDRERSDTSFGIGGI
jgi:hypothetical protein